MKKRIRRAGCLAWAALLLSVSTEASSLRYSGQTSTENYTPGNVDVFDELLNAHNGDSLHANRLVGPDSTTVASVFGEATFGRLATFSHVGGSPSPGTPNDGAFYAAGLGVSSSDTITIHGTATGFLSLDVYFHGVLNKPSSLDSFATGNFGIQVVDEAIGILQSGGVSILWSNSNPATKNPQPGPGISLDLWNAATVTGGNGYTFQGQTSILIPILQNTFDVNFLLGSSVFCHLPCLATSDFANTALIGGAKIVDAFGNIIPGASFTTQSGFDYQSGPVGASSVPEPATAMLTAGALGVLLWRLRRR